MDTLFGIVAMAFYVVSTLLAVCGPALLIILAYSA